MKYAKNDAPSIILEDRIIKSNFALLVFNFSNQIVPPVTVVTMMKIVTAL